MGVGTIRLVIGKYQARGNVNLNLALSDEITDVGQACGLARDLDRQSSDRCRGLARRILSYHGAFGKMTEFLKGIGAISGPVRIAKATRLGDTALREVLG